MLKSHRRGAVSGARNLLSRARDIVSGLIDHISEAIKKALGKEQDDEDGEQLSQSDIVDMTVNDLIDELPELIAETETTGAIESAVLDTLKDGGVQRVRCENEPDACNMCRALADQGAIDINGEFEGGITLPAHPRCRCHYGLVDEEE
jgi:hypothetical protein